MNNNQIKIVIFFLLIFSFPYSFGQMRRIEDKAIVAQHKRMVYERWGDFRPYPRYILGIQIRPAYALTWGWLAPSRNRRYRRGADIRPLSPDGEETLRFAEIQLQKRNAERIKEGVDSLLQDNRNDFKHWNPLTVDVDPLWLLYYKRMLRPLKDFPENPQTYADWGFTNPDVYNRLVANSDIEILKEKLELLKEKYRISRTVAMPRGKRFLMYHKILVEWRKFKQRKDAFDKRSFRGLELGQMMFVVNTSNVNFNHRSDTEIVREILERNNFLETDEENN